ncbi:MAG: phosphoglycerate kinase [Patescibacteria group bacterium]
MYMTLRTLANLTIAPSTRALVRADFDVGADGDTITDTFRIEAVLPTIRLLLERGARVRLMAHRGRPGGTRNPAFSLAPVARFVSHALNREVLFAEDIFADTPADADVILFENLRFWPGEEQSDPVFARALAVHGDIYINEAFAAYRGHASIAMLPRLLPAYAGLHLEKEINALERVLVHPQRPMTAIFGGLKIETKLPIIRRFLQHADQVIVGGALANTIFALRGNAVGKSATDTTDGSDLSFLEDPKLILPSDVITAPRLAAGAPSAVRQMGDVHPDEYIADIGPESRQRFLALLASAQTVVWNGPMGFAEAPEFSRGTIALAERISKLNAFTVIGGGDTITILKQYGALSGFSHVSTGGGAMLEFLSGKKLPGLEPLSIS